MTMDQINGKLADDINAVKRDVKKIQAVATTGCMCYQDGTGVEKDIEEAAELYQRALDYGYEPTEEEKPRVEEVLGSTPLANP